DSKTVLTVVRGPHIALWCPHPSACLELPESILFKLLLHVEFLFQKTVYAHYRTWDKELAYLAHRHNNGIAAGDLVYGTSMKYHSSDILPHDRNHDTKQS